MNRSSPSLIELNGGVKFPTSGILPAREAGSARHRKGRKEMKKFIFAVAAMLLISAAAHPVSAGDGTKRGGSDNGRLEFRLYEGDPWGFPAPPSGYAEAGGTVKYNLTGPVLNFTVKAYGLEAGTVYHVTTCRMEVGAGVADEHGNMTVVGSAGGEYYLESIPDDFFSIRLASHYFSIIMLTDAHGYDWSVP